MSAHRWDPICTRPDGLVTPSRLDPTGALGPTRGQAAGPHWERLASGWYAPTSRGRSVEQRILDATCQLVGSGGITGWAALRWRGGACFDGLDRTGRIERPVPLLLGMGSVRPRDGVWISKEQFAPTEREQVGGIGLASVQRALFDEVRRSDDLWAAVAAIDMAVAARLISVELFAEYVAHRAAWEGVPLAREAISLAVEGSRSPKETWLRLVWILVADLDPPLCNRSVYDRDGQLVGTPDLLDPVAGLAVEYDGADHRTAARHLVDVDREARFRDHRIEYVTIVQGHSRAVAAVRIRAARRRALFLPTTERPWTLEPPTGVTPAEPVDVHLRRLGLAQALTHR